MYRKKSEILKSTNEKVLCIFIHFGALLFYFSQLFVTLPRFYGEGFSSKTKVVHVISGTYLLVNWLISYWSFLLIDPSFKKSVHQKYYKSSWNFCKKSQMNIPPRSFFCSICEKVILLRDHHCYFSPNCMGYANRRYFLLWGLYFNLALVYTNFLNAHYVIEIYQSSTWKTAIACFLPGLAFMLGIEFKQYIVRVAVVMGVFLISVFTIRTFSGHIYLAFIGKTSYEYKHKKGEEYNLPICENLRHAFGTNWKFSWISR